MDKNFTALFIAQTFAAPLDTGDQVRLTARQTIPAFRSFLRRARAMEMDGKTDRFAPLERVLDHDGPSHTIHEQDAFSAKHLEFWVEHLGYHGVGIDEPLVHETSPQA